MVITRLSALLSGHAVSGSSCILPHFMFRDSHFFLFLASLCKPLRFRHPERELFTGRVTRPVMQSAMRIYSYVTSTR